MIWTKIKFAVRVSTVILLAGNLFLFSNNVAATEFEVDGVLTFQQIGANNKVISEQKENFEVSVKDCQWFIVTEPNPESAKIIRYEIGGENGTIYQVAYFDKNAIDPNSQNTAIGLIENDVVPENIAGNRITELWLAFASSCYLDSAKNGMLKPIYRMPDPSMRSEDWEDTAKWKRFDAAPYLPQEVVYWYENIIGMNGTNRVVIQPPPPFEKGFTRASYNADSVTNIGGLTLPLSFSSKEYFLMPRDKTADLEMEGLVQGTVTNMRTTCERTNFIPELTEATYVGDRRFARMPKPVEELPYMVTNGIWPSANAQWLQNMYQHELNVRAHMIRPIESSSPLKKYRGSTHKGLLIILSIFAVAIATGIFLFITKKRNS